MEKYNYIFYKGLIPKIEVEKYDKIYKNGRARQ